MQPTIESITPEIASRYLETAHPTLRKVIRSNVERFATVMRGGCWNQSPDAVAFDIDGSLINGRHRLLAVVKSRVTVPMLVVRELPRRAFESIDIGTCRSTRATVLAHGASYRADERERYGEGRL
jgi:hypothetical protein